MDTESIIAAIDAEISKLQQARAVLAERGIADATAAPTSRHRKRRKLSKEARERIAAAQRKRWARAKQGAKVTPISAPKNIAKPGKSHERRKPKLSAEARRRIAAAQRKRWAAGRAANKVVKPTFVKKVAMAGRAKKAPAVKVKKAAPGKASAPAKEAVRP